MESYNLLLNITNGIKSLQEDFVSFSINMTDIFHVLENIFVSFIIILTFLLFGRKIRILFFNYIDNKGLAYFIDIALGYIVVGSGIALLGSLSILHHEVLLFYLFSIFLLAMFPLNNLIILFKDFGLFFKKIKLAFTVDKWIFLGVCIFLLISFLRLIPPEIGEDSVGYHTDLPLMYLKKHTMIIPSKEIQHVLPIPQLGEMSYVITQYLGVKDASRYLHFMFYVLIVLILICWGYYKKNRFIGLYCALLFVTASVVIRHASKANVDYQMMFCWLVSIFVLLEFNKHKFLDIGLSAIILGGAMSTKLWAMVFLPILLIYILIINKIKKPSTYRLIGIFILFSFSTSFLWYLRTFIITGNPFYPAFANTNIINNQFNLRQIFTYIGINTSLFNFDNLIAFSPLFFLSIAFILPKLFTQLKMMKEIVKNRIFLFFVILATEHIFIQYYLGRYLLPIYSICIIVVAILIDKLSLYKNIVFKVFFLLILFLQVAYYFSTTLLILPYGFGWADKNKYLTRILSRDNSSYYNFDNLFEKWIDKSDVIAMHEIFGFYYANFSYIDDNYIFDEKNNSFDLLKKKGINKLLIKGGNILWYCKKLNLTNCDENKVKLLATYPKSTGKYNLYAIIENNLNNGK